MFRVSGVDLFKGVEFVTNFEVGEWSRVNDVNVGDKGSSKKLFLFISALTGDKEVKIYNIPLEAWNVEGISRIASRVGNHIIMDRIITTMCERSYGKASFARVLVEVDSTKGLANSLEVWYMSLGKSMLIDVEYAWRPLVCEHCKIFGHTLKSCSAKDLTDDEKAIKKAMKPVKVEVNAESNDGLKSVTYRRNVYGRGGFSNNGRVSFEGSKGGYMNVGGRNNRVNRQYVPVKSNERNIVNKEECVGATKEDLGKNGSIDEVTRDTIVGNGSVSGSNSKKVKANDDICLKNRFSALNNEENSEDLVKWREFCTRIYTCVTWIVKSNKGIKENATKAVDKRIIDEYAAEYNIWGATS
nr:hypothetical protein [Tanacetum cinerariifolium]